MSSRTVTPGVPVCGSGSIAAVARNEIVLVIPTLMAFREGVLVFSQPGALPAAVLEDDREGARARH